MQIVIFGVKQRPARFWQLMGPMFASSVVRKELPYLMDRGYEWHVALMDGIVVGFSAVDMRDHKSMLIHDYVVRDYRGKGVAKRLVKSRLARCSGTVETVATEKWSRTFEKMGFECVGNKGRYRVMRKVAD